MSVFDSEQVKEIDSIIVTLKEVSTKLAVLKGHVESLEEDTQDEDEDSDDDLGGEIEILIGNLDGAIDELDEVIEHLENTK